MPTSSATPLSVHRSFVVQFAARTHIAAGCCVGRVEHIVSGQATRFASQAELLAFIARVLLQTPPRPPVTVDGQIAPSTSASKSCVR